jgi:hypothetical protein
MLFTRFCVGLLAGCFLNATHAFAEDESLKPKQVGDFNGRRGISCQRHGPPQT